MTDLDASSIEAMAEGLAAVRERGGRLFILGVGGSAGHAGHAVNDFRKLCGFEAYAPTDNVSELTARTNDEGWETVFSVWLSRFPVARRATASSCFSVGGGDRERNVSANIVRALELAQRARGRRLRHRRATGRLHREGRRPPVSIIPPLVDDRITPHTEGLAAVVWHLLVSHPLLQTHGTKWESTR